MISMNDKDPRWNYDEFLCFLLLHASYVDMEFSDEERDKLNEKFGKDLVLKMHTELEKLSDFETLEAILSYKDIFYPSIEQKKYLMDQVKRLFFADGDYSIMEREFYRFLDKLM